MPGPMSTYWEKIHIFAASRGISSVGRAPGSQSGGQGFDPPMLHRTERDGRLPSLSVLWSRLFIGGLIPRTPWVAVAPIGCRLSLFCGAGCHQLTPCRYATSPKGECGRSLTRLPVPPLLRFLRNPADAPARRLKPPALRSEALRRNPPRVAVAPNGFCCSGQLGDSQFITRNASPEKWGRHFAY